MSIEDHLSGGNGLISTSLDENVARWFAIPNGRVLRIDDHGSGIPVQYTRETWHLRGEREVVFTRIEGHHIESAVRPNDGEDMAIRNPDYA